MNDQIINPEDLSPNLVNPDRVEQVKTPEQVEYEKTEEGIKEHIRHQEYMAKKKDRRKAENLEKIKDEIKYFEEQGNLSLDGGIRHADMPEKSAGRHLSQQEILFCKFYAATGSVSKSLSLAGLNKQDMYLLQKAAVRAYLAELTDLRLKRLGYDRNTVIENLAIIANQDVKDYMTITKSQVKAQNGGTYERTDVNLKTLDDIDAEYMTDEYGDFILDDQGHKILISSGKTKAIKSIRYNDNGKVIMEFHDKLTALKQLANMLDMESPQKITLNDETHRRETERSLLEKLKAFTDKVEEEKADNKQPEKSQETSEEGQT